MRKKSLVVAVVPILLAAAGPIQKHQVTTDVRRPDRPNHEKDDRGSSEE